MLALLMVLSLSVASCGKNQEPKPDPNPDATPGVTDPTPNDPTPDEPTPDAPTPDKPTPDEPTPDDPTPDDGAFLVEDAEEFKKPFTGYETITVENGNLQVGELVLIDASHPYSADKAGEVVRVKSYNVNGFAAVLTSKTTLNFVALRKMQEMNSDMQTALNVTYLLCIQAGYLTNEELTDLHTNYPGEYPEAAGESDLHTGRAATVSVFTGAMNYPFRNSAVTNVAGWVEENAHKYGYIMGNDVNENAKLRYVGVPHATYMQANGLDLAGYLAKLQDGEKLQITDHQDLTWTVYRVEASEGASSEIQVPTGMTYSISGDNDGGFIVTVKGICE